MSSSNPRKISGLHPENRGLYYKPEKNPCTKPEKKGLQNPEIFLGFEIDLDFSRP